MPHNAVVLFAGIVSLLSGVYSLRPPDAARPPESDQPVGEALPPASPMLAPIDGDENGNAVRRTEEAIAALHARLNTATDAAEKVQIALAAANLILSERIEPPCSHVILQLEAGEASASLREPLDRAGGLLEAARTALDRADAGEGNADAWRPQAAHRLETLEAFHAGLSAYLLPTDDERTPRRAASRLSPLLEDPDRAVAAAATFWQACLRSLDPDESRAMSVLELALSDVRADDLPYAFFARLMRCRLIAREGGHAAAIALLLQMEERCHDWFLEETERRTAVRTIHLTRAQLLRSWKQSLADSKDEAARQWIDEQVRQIETEIFREGENTVMRLRPVIPPIATVPAATNSGPAPDGPSEDDLKD